MLDQKVGSHFWLSEFLRSDDATRYGINNTPPAAELRNIIGVLAPGMQRVRDMLGQPVFITSGYRCPVLNKAVKGSPKSQHMRGLAADFICPMFGTPKTVAKYLMERAPDVRFEQLIFEGGWVHLGFPESGAMPRGEVLTAHFMGGEVSYSRGIV